MNSDIIPGAMTLIDIDGTTNDTPTHMTGLNERLAEAFPAVGNVLDHIKAGRHSFREQHGHLSFAEQDEIWQVQYPGTTSHSQLDIYKTFAPEVFDSKTESAVRDWLSVPENLGSAEYEDVQFLLYGLQKIGSPAVLFTLGDTKFWQPTKTASLPSLRDLPSHITATLPKGGKGAVMVDDSIHNLHLPRQALGILIDRHNKKTDWDHPVNVRVVRSLTEVPDIVEEYAAMRQELN